ncbi:Hypothetical predicted protein [Podarcis lilfordi]|uniref:Uncharacterized protein n=1 Tax=Podarcis lilfordi TaxID=74358 RepID=A0AA35PR20_9SAUR|nr:Hypothetical predicted protein [Podarcis lilfordi]
MASPTVDPPRGGGGTDQMQSFERGRWGRGDTHTRLLQLVWSRLKFHRESFPPALHSLPRGHEVAQKRRSAVLSAWRFKNAIREAL